MKQESHLRTRLADVPVMRLPELCSAPRFVSRVRRFAVSSLRFFGAVVRRFADGAADPSCPHVGGADFRGSPYLLCVSLVAHQALRRNQLDLYRLQILPQARGRRLVSGEPTPEAATKRFGVLVLGLGNVLLGDDGLAPPRSPAWNATIACQRACIWKPRPAARGYKPAARKSDTAAVVGRGGQRADISRHSKWSARDSDAVVVNSQRSANLGAGRLHNLAQEPIESSSLLLAIILNLPLHQMMM